MAMLHTPMSDVLAPCQEGETDPLLLEAWPSIRRVAQHLASTYRWANPRLEADDLAQIGSLAALEALHRGLHTTGNPVAYLIAIGKCAMRRQCGQHVSLITSPRKANGSQPRVLVLSLDAALSPAAALTLLDVLEADGTSA